MTENMNQQQNNKTILTICTKL